MDTEGNGPPTPETAEESRLKLEVARLTGELEAARAALTEAECRIGSLKAALDLANETSAKAIDRLRAATERSERATELLQRWHRLAVERWHDHATTQIDADTRAFLNSGGAPTFESLVAATGELPATGLASAEPPPNSCEDGGQTNPAVRRDRCGEADRPVARISKGMALCGPCWQVTGGAPTTGEARSDGAGAALADVARLQEELAEEKRISSLRESAWVNLLPGQLVTLTIHDRPTPKDRP